MGTVTQRELDKLLARVVGLREGEVEVIDAAVVLQLNSAGDETIEVTLVLSDPPAGQETWKLNDVHALQEEVRRIVVGELKLSAYLAIVLGGPRDSEGADEDDDNEGALNEEWGN